ncbi:hypothetical protein NQ315_006187 [Exocentrus adspersus]|uniref:E3 ubiquitin-protein ligase n=1 Tax=Exocentrus adspersus TaxID=1586481 RepID=A0AAV8VZA6_9CUCU|nr:hypothetical protein NQ315_006187 [Exocentrus adspersus]
MAEATSSESSNSESKPKSDSPECAVCLQPCVHPAQLPCGHIFCFLCVKGFANQNKKCAMCRQEIPRDFIDQPNLLHRPAPVENPQGFDGGYQWFYEGRNGWWKYDERTSEEIEQAYKLELSAFELIICGELYVIDFDCKHQYPKRCPSWWQYDERTSKELEISYKNGEKTCELLIAGFLYIVDLENMLQLRRNDPSRRRRIKRDHANIPKKGIAGLRTDEESNRVVEAYEERPLSPIDGRTDNVVPVTPSNTPQSPTSGRESPDQEQDLQATVERISSLRLDNNETGSILNSIITDNHYCRHRSTD